MRTFIKKLRRQPSKAIEVDVTDPLIGKIVHKPVFAIGTGRCGTHFLNRVMELDPAFLSMHADSLEMNISDSFARYCVWNKLPVDMEPFRDYRHRLIANTSGQEKIYFESNAYLSLLAGKLYEWYGAKIILLIRKPEDVVNSHWIKGWYEPMPKRGDTQLAVGFQANLKPNQSFGRIMPNGPAYETWKDLTRIGKISWWVNTLNMEVLRQLRELPEESWRIVKLEQLDYERSKELHSFVGGRKLFEKNDFEALRKKKPGKGPKKRSVETWSALEMEEFLAQTKDLRAAFSYSEPHSG